MSFSRGCGASQAGRKPRYCESPQWVVSGSLRADQGARLNRMDDLTSHSEVVHCALCRHWHGATVKISAEAMVALI
jgi:hypothetical protein